MRFQMQFERSDLNVAEKTVDGSGCDSRGFEAGSGGRGQS